MQLNDERYRQTWHDFVRHPTSARLREEMGMSFGIALIAWILALIAAPIMMVTIRWTLDGLRMLWGVITFEPFREIRDHDPASNPDSFQPILAHGIIIGPDRVHALLVSTFRQASEYSVDQVALIGVELGRLYSHGPQVPAEEATYKLLRDDSYFPNRRRKLPDDHPAAALNLVLLDAELDLRETRQSPLGTLLVAMVAKKGDSGPTAQLPWPVIESALQLN